MILEFKDLKHPIKSLKLDIEFDVNIHITEEQKTQHILVNTEGKQNIEEEF